MAWMKSFTEGRADMKGLLGGKGANLAEMTAAGLPVPPGFTITTEACHAYHAQDGRLPEGLMPEVQRYLLALEEAKGQQFGSAERPLLVSVRSGAPVSMPGMMDTILNLGLNDETVQGLAALTNDPRFAYDCYRRFVQMFGNVVFDIEAFHFETELQRMKRTLGVNMDSEVTAEGWQSLIGRFQRIVAREAGRPFPQQTDEQLLLAIQAVFRSWNNPRARIYRKANRISDGLGTAVTIQAMVFGNRGDDSGTGVLFTRNPSTGERALYGEFLLNAQGEDVVAGVRTPQPISGLAAAMPDAYRELEAMALALERHYRDMQDIEFTIEQGRIYLLQTRAAKRNARAAVAVAVAMAREGLITREEAIARIDPLHLDQLLHRSIDEGALSLVVLATGLPASPGAATGDAVFDADTAETWARGGRKVILIRDETTPEDIHGVLAAEGVLTARGGMTSHAAVVARGMGKPCVCGCEALRLDGRSAAATTGSGERVTIAEGERITIDGSTGRVLLGEAPLREPELTAELEELLRWADGVRRLRVYTNADTPEDAAKALELGAEGIGLCRTEHMFMSPERAPLVQAMIMAETAEERAGALARLLPLQQDDFERMLRAMGGRPVTIRLLDPPLHEFLPRLDQLLVEQERARHTDGSDPAEEARLSGLVRRVRALHEQNPMLGTRGCRLGLMLPDIYEMQVEAIGRAVAGCLAEKVPVSLDLLVPLVGHVNELRRMRELIERKLASTLGEGGAGSEGLAFRIGTMIEVPRAAITAAQIASHADFFSFGTNDLTQMTFGYSRDDAEGKFLSHYVDSQILGSNPFQVLDEEGVGYLIRWAVEQGRSVNPDLKTGICGEHGGDRDSIFFCHGAGLDYVSCSPYRVPSARIAAAQAQLALGDAAERGTEAGDRREGRSA